MGLRKPYGSTGNVQQTATTGDLVIQFVYRITPRGWIPRYRGTSCTRKVCTSQESFVDIGLGPVVGAHLEKCAVSKNPKPFLFEGEA